jgi:protocatechuate 3,4-dioxygenase beta subunit
MSIPTNSIKAVKGNGPMMVHGVGILDLVCTFKSPPLPDRQFTLSGQTLDLNGNPLPNCVIQLFYTGQSDAKNNVLTPPGMLGATTTSDANGNFTFNIGPNRQFQLVAYLPGSPDVAGVTVNTLVGA